MQSKQSTKRPLDFGIFSEMTPELREPPPEDIAGSSRNPREVLRAGPGYKNVITTDLVDDTLLSAENLRTFKSTFKELYDFSMVRLE
jgi:hypothetical protein